jgi:hypothetical protein
VELIRERNGGVLRDTCYPTDFRTSWAADHFQVDVILGIGFENGIDAESAYLIEEWEYPPVGVVLGMTPSAGHDTVMLDYATAGPDAEPAVVYVGDDRVPHRVAGSFGQFLAGLVPEDTYN